jgi:hypothetical protein
LRAFLFPACGRPTSTQFGTPIPPSPASAARAGCRNLVTPAPAEAGLGHMPLAGAGTRPRCLRDCPSLLAVTHPPLGGHADRRAPDGGGLRLSTPRQTIAPRLKSSG